MWVGGQRHVPVPLPPGKTLYQLYRRLGGTQGRSGRVRKFSSTPEFHPRTVHPAASFCTDWAIPAPKIVPVQLVKILTTSTGAQEGERFIGLSRMKYRSDQATGWTSKEQCFDSRQFARDFSLLQIFHKKCDYLYRYERKLRSRFSMPVWNQYFCMDMKHGLSHVKSDVRYKLL